MKVLKDLLITFAVALTMAVLTVVSIPAVVHAQSQMQVRIPFDFYIGTQKFPSGHYSVQVSGMYLKVSDEAGHSAFALTNTVANPESKTLREGKLLFTHYDGYYFLSEVRRAGYTAGNGLIRTPLEAGIAKGSGDKERLALTATQ